MVGVLPHHQGRQGRPAESPHEPEPAPPTAAAYAATAAELHPELLGSVGLPGV